MRWICKVELYVIPMHVNPCVGHKTPHKTIGNTSAHDRGPSISRARAECQGPELYTLLTLFVAWAVTQLYNTR